MVKLGFRVFILIVIISMTVLVTGCFGGSPDGDEPIEKKIVMVSYLDVSCMFNNELVIYKDVYRAIFNDYSTRINLRNGIVHSYTVSVPCHKIEYEKELIKKDSFDSQY